MRLSHQIDSHGTVLWNTADHQFPQRHSTMVQSRKTMAMPSKSTQVLLMN